MIDAFQPEAITRLAVDSIFMMPHLGVLSSVNAEAATQVFERDCLVYIGTCIAPIGKGKFGSPCLTYDLELPSGKQSGVLNVGDLLRFPLGAEEEAALVIKPERGWDIGAGPGQGVQTSVPGGDAGIIIDGRGRPLVLPEDKDERVRQILTWNRVLGLYPTL
ncbi:MAG: hypothetical protein O3B73_08225 [bacterium]|nr:hypothetical protein [bacterium]